MQQGKAYRFTLDVGWLVAALTVVLIATLFVSGESISEYFWHRVWWTEFLVFLVWGSAGFYLRSSNQSEDKATRIGGISPTMSMLIVVYSLLSFSVMIAHSLISETDAGNRTHIIIQIILFSGVCMSIVSLSIARIGGSAGLPFNKTSAATPRMLHDLLELCESSLPTSVDGPSGLKVTIKQLREALLYSLHDSASLSQSEQYQAFSKDVNLFCDSVEDSQPHIPNNDDDHTSLIEAAKALIGETTIISSNLKAG